MDPFVMVTEPVIVSISGWIVDVLAITWVPTDHVAVAAPTVGLGVGVGELLFVGDGVACGVVGAGVGTNAPVSVI